MFFCLSELTITKVASREPCLVLKGVRSLQKSRKRSPALINYISPNNNLLPYCMWWLVTTGYPSTLRVYISKNRQTYLSHFHRSNTSSSNYSSFADKIGFGYVIYLIFCRSCRFIAKSIHIYNPFIMLCFFPLPIDNMFNPVHYCLLRGKNRAEGQKRGRS